MSDFNLGVYWRERSMTLRQYNDATKKYLACLQKKHPIFSILESKGNAPGELPLLDQNFSNLDELIYRCSWDKKLNYEHSNSDGSPSWDSPATVGYRMFFIPAMEDTEISIRIFAGANSKFVSNSVVISFPSHEETQKNSQMFYDYNFIRDLFETTIQHWAPRHGLIFSQKFSEKIDSEGLPGVGWLTYLRDPRAAALHNDIRFKDFLFEEIEGGGTLITLDRKIIDLGNDQQVANARLLRDTLIAQQLIDV